MLNNERSLQRSILKRNSVGAHVEERTRRVVSYGPPAFQIDDVVKILKDTSPGAHPRYSYDKLGKIMSVVDGNGSHISLYIAPPLISIGKSRDQRRGNLNRTLMKDIV